jgi:hypothetical protein
LEHDRLAHHPRGEFEQGQHGQGEGDDGRGDHEPRGVGERVEQLGQEFVKVGHDPSGERGDRRGDGVRLNEQGAAGGNGGEDAGLSGAGREREDRLPYAWQRQRDTTQKREQKQTDNGDHGSTLLRLGAGEAAATR